MINNEDYELWSLKENMAYTIENAKLTLMGSVMVLTTPKGEILVTRLR